MITNSIHDYYANNLAAHGHGAQGVGWKNEEAQRVRFQQLIKVIQTTGPFSINDLGCGVGALLPFLRSIFKSFSYQGYDVMDEMIDAACKEYKENASVQFHKIKEAKELMHADYTVASGIFNLRFSTSVSDWKKYILETLNDIDEYSDKGFAFNALTSYSDKEFMKDELFYSDPTWLFDYCKKQFAENVALLHDYGQYDFTILVKKTL